MESAIRGGGGLSSQPPCVRYLFLQFPPMTHIYIEDLRYVKAVYRVEPLY